MYGEGTERRKGHGGRLVPRAADGMSPLEASQSPRTPPPGRDCVWRWLGFGEVWTFAMGPAHTLYPATRGHGEKTGILGGGSPGHRACRHRDRGRPASRTVRDQRLEFQAPACGRGEHPELTETPRSRRLKTGRAVTGFKPEGRLS